MARLRFSSLDGVLDMAVTGTDSSLLSTDFADLPVVAHPDYLALILDPGEFAGPPEIVWVVAHLDGSDTVTVQRGMEQQYGAPAGRPHAYGTVWHHGPTPGDFVEDVDGAIHTTSSDPIKLTARVVSRQMPGTDIEAFTDTGQFAVIDLVLACVSGAPAWTSHTGILISWVGGSAPTLTSTAGNYDVIRLTRVAPFYAGSLFQGEHVVVDATLNLV